MEIQELNLIAFGPFTDRILEFSTSGSGLHIVYGPNEAGKSSSLRGLKGLLFGIPGRTTDNFLHENKDMRIAATLGCRSGKVLTVVRRKGNKNTLLTPDGNQLDDAALVPYLHGVSAEIFEMLFGIDHETLVQGGQEILDQKGEIGQALFAASMGSASLHAALEQLESEADALFKPRGSTQAINSHLKEYVDCQKAIKETSLSSREWTEKRRGLERTDKELEAVKEALLESSAERNRLRRTQKALPKISTRQDLLDQREALGNVVMVSEDFGKRREEATLALGNAQATAMGATKNLSGLKGEFESVVLDTQLLEFGEIIKDLHARLGEHRKAMRDRPHLEAARLQLVADSEELLKTVRPDLKLTDVEILRPVMNRSVRVTELGSQSQALVQQVSRAKKVCRNTKDNLEKANESLKKMAEAVSPETLRKQVILSRKLGDMDAAIGAGQEQMDSVEQECNDKLSRLSALWHGSLNDIPGLVLPIRESIDRVDQAYTDFENKFQRLEDKHEEYTNSASEARKQLEEILNAGAVPTEGELLDVRTGRDLVWTLLRRKWVDDEVVDTQARELDPERELPDLFESRITDADEVSDRLRREADRVQKKAALTAMKTDAEEQVQRITGQLDGCKAEKAQLDSEWSLLWELTSVQPLSPREMRVWLDNMESLRARVDELNEQRRAVSSLKNTRRSHANSLQKELEAAGETPSETESLELLLVESEAKVAELDALGSEHKSIAREIEKLEAGLEEAANERKEANEEFEEWKVLWLGVVDDLGLEVDALPAEAFEILKSITSLFAKLKEADDIELRINGIDQDAQGFDAELGNVVGTVRSSYAELSTEEAVSRLNKNLEAALKDETKRNQLEGQIEKAQGTIDQAEEICSTMTDKLAALCEEAQCGEYTELDNAEHKSNRSKALAESIDSIERELLEIGEGLSLDALQKEIEGVDPDMLPGEIEVLTSKIDEELVPQQTEFAIEKGEQQHELSLMNGSDAAATIADTAQSILVGIRSNSEQYVRLKLASRILRDEIERYRQQHQGPLLVRASQHFTELTQGSFDGLRADFNEKDEPILVGVRLGGASVLVEGMSSGTRDQLYLALRLASLEKYMETADPMPFIVDDILVHFDDERSKATLAVLAELATKTQVILFTHHRRLVEQAEALQGPEPVTVHEL
jgi:uncharacterized protein YhaN